MTPTPQQLAVILSVADKILCVAGPGSGKTHTLVKRILRLIEQGIDPASIAVIVYTNRAARILHERLHPKSGEFAINLGFLGTRHSFCLRHLQEYAGMANVTVLDDEEADAELLRCARAAGVKASEKELKARRHWWSIRQYDQHQDAVHIAVASYYRQMEGSRALDFNSILTKARDHLRTCTATSGPQQRAWKHYLVDEGHDNSRLDMEIDMAVAADNRFYVCDPDQAIFAFRSGDVRCILELARSGEWEVHKLEGNFRCGQAICDAAQKLIEHNTDRIEKRTFSLRPEPDQDSAHKTSERFTDSEATVRAASYASDVEEAMSIAVTISLRTAKLEGPRLDPSDIAVLARTNTIADGIAATLAAHGIPIRHKTAPTLPEDWTRAKAVIRMLQSRGDDSIIRAVRAGNANTAADAARQAALGKLDLRKEFMSGLECTIEGLMRDLQRLRISHESRERIDKIWDGMPEATLADLVLAVMQQWEPEETGEGVTCTTVHQAKGGEWDTVILAGFEEETIPGTRADRDIQEERRIAYVGMTRAKRTLRITHAAARRNTWGRREYRDMTPSRFIVETGL